MAEKVYYEFRNTHRFSRSLGPEDTKAGINSIKSRRSKGKTYLDKAAQSSCAIIMQRRGMHCTK